MSAAQKGLGRGLGALFQDEPVRPVPDNENSSQIGIELIGPNPSQPRKDFDDEALNELAASIKENGLIQPILVRPSTGGGATYEIVAGERRWRASKLAGLTTVPVVIKELSDRETLALALIENLQREDLNPLEEAWGIQRLKDEFGLSQDEVAKQLGKSRSAVANILRLINLSENAQQDLRQGRISAGHARALLAFEDPEMQEQARRRIIDEKLSVREAEALAFESKNPPAPAESAAATAASPVTGVAKRAARKPQSAVLAELQGRISAAVSLPVKISGKESKGRLNISYGSKEELEALLARLGVESV